MPKAKHGQSPVDELTYEQALAEMETIVESLEASQVSLEETIRLFERGQALTRHCLALLDKAELRIKKLSGDTLVDVPAEN